ncbi:MAG: lysylphosphatidylglycerol synthase transmembrane domain-containing protein [Calothrix sp. MO_192.B10]|nr:lysylphosphatidylglycerol synthase transmembrane domain-containing protein [Calothrix sp. MO_192.B10]
MKKIISILVSLTILAIIYWKIDAPKLVEVFQNSDRWWMTISLGMVVPLAMLTAWRLQQLMPNGSRLGFGEANRLVLAASVLNMVLPSKMGDIAKAYFIKEKRHLNGSLSLSLVVFEKACDLLSILIWCAFGLIIYPQKNWLIGMMLISVVFGIMIGLMLIASRRFYIFVFQTASKIAPKKLQSLLEVLRLSWSEMHDYFWQNKSIVLKVAGISILISFGHILQIWLLILALQAWTPFLTHIALCQLSILAGLLPLTFAGAGTRDAAIITFYQPYLNESTAAALGLLCTSRYLLLAIGGLPFLGQYLTTIKKIRGQSEAGGRGAGSRRKPYT